MASKQSLVLDTFFQLRNKKKLVTAKEVSNKCGVSHSVCWKWLKQNEDYIEILKEIKAERAKTGNDSYKVKNFLSNENGKIIQNFNSFKLAAKCCGLNYDKTRLGKTRVKRR